jgi:hypothetical protein
MAAGPRSEEKRGIMIKRINLALQGGGAHGAYTSIGRHFDVIGQRSTIDVKKMFL